jgi:phage terminase large subunit-like protein
MTGTASAPGKLTRRSTPPPSTSVDPVTQYARDVVEGRIVACRAVKQTCQRHLTDLTKQRTAAFPYYFDVAAAQHIIDFFPRFLTLESGAAFILPPWLQFCYGFIYGWKVWGGSKAVAVPPEHASRAGLRRIMHGYFETSKGSGKTPSAGGIALYGAAYDDEPYAEIYTTGFDREQAAIILNDAIRMGQNSSEDDFRAEFILDKYNIAHPSSGSFIRAMSAQHQSKSGPRPHYVLSDEIMERRDGTVVSKAEAGFKNRKQPLGLKYTNSGSDKTSYCWELHQKSLAVLDGTLVDEQWFAYVCHLDPCQACFEEGYRQPKDGCADCDNWLDPAVWPKVAPALGIVIQPKYLQDAIDVALTTASEYSLKRRLNFCIWTETHQVWISSERLAACQVEAVSTDNASARACAAGLDPSSVHDLTAFVVAIRQDDPVRYDGTKPVEVEIEGRDEFGQHIREVYSLNFSVELIPFFWAPDDKVLDYVRTERIPFDTWKRQGHLFTTRGESIDHNAVYDFVMDAWKRFKIKRVGMDQNAGQFLFQRLRDDGRLGDQIVPVGQGFKLSEAFKFIEMLVAHKRLRHAGHPILNWCFANAEPDRHPRTGALAIVKPSDKKRIDGVIATAMAIRALMDLPIKKRRAAGAFVIG